MTNTNTRKPWPSGTVRDLRRPLDRIRSAVWALSEGVANDATEAADGEEFRRKAEHHFTTFLELMEDVQQELQGAIDDTAAAMDAERAAERQPEET